MNPATLMCWGYYWVQSFGLCVHIFSEYQTVFLNNTFCTPNGVHALLMSMFMDILCVSDLLHLLYLCSVDYFSQEPV